jgi:hypothetical protein
MFARGSCECTDGVQPGMRAVETIVVAECSESIGERPCRSPLLQDERGQAIIYDVGGLVIAPCEADDTSAAYFAKTPVG